jgi:hypothetical protein
MWALPALAPHLICFTAHAAPPLAKFATRLIPPGGYFYNAGDAMRHYPAFSTAMELAAKAALYSDLLSNKFIGRSPSTYLLPVNDALSKVALELGKAPAGAFL